MRRGLILLAAAAALLLAAGASASAAPTLDYVALGDSVASGHGLLDNGGTCRRSPRAYPRLVLAELRERRSGAVRFATFACSGAAASLPASGLQELAAQVDRALGFLRKGRPALVTLTVGVNDLAWADIPATYMRLREPDAVFRLWLATRVDAAEAAVEHQLKRLLARRTVRVVLTDYPNPVNEQSLLFGGPLPCVDVQACYARTELLVHELNAALAGLVRPRVRLASVHDAFRGHEAPRPRCGGAGPDVAQTWFQHPDDPDSNSFPPVEQLLGETWRGDCFHPNAAGAAAIATAVGASARAAGR